jgi:hypothetical protein
MDDPKKKSSFNKFEKINCTVDIFFFITSQMNRTGTTIDDELQKMSPLFSIHYLQFSQMFHIDIDITKTAFPECSLSANRAHLWSGKHPIQSGIFQNMSDIDPFLDTVGNALRQRPGHPDQNS